MDGLKARTPEVLLKLSLVLLVQTRQHLDLPRGLPVYRGSTHYQAERRVDCQLLVLRPRQARQVVQLAQTHRREQLPGYLFVCTRCYLVVELGVPEQSQFAFVEVEKGTIHPYINCMIQLSDAFNCSH